MATDGVNHKRSLFIGYGGMAMKTYSWGVIYSRNWYLINIAWETKLYFPKWYTQCVVLNDKTSSDADIHTSCNKGTVKIQCASIAQW